MRNKLKIKIMKTKIYISGRISGLTEREYKQNFLDAEWVIACTNRYADRVNPCDIKPLFGIKSYWFHMAADIWALLFCSHVAFQKNWIDSKGARIEMLVAILFNKKIIML